MNQRTVSGYIWILFIALFVFSPYPDKEAFSSHVKRPRSTPTPQPTPVPTPAPTPASACTKTISPGSLQSASDSARPGDTICVTGGLLSRALNFNTSGTQDDWITYKAVGSVTIRPGLTNQVRIYGDNIVLDGFRITEAHSFKIFGQNVVFQNGRVDHNKYDGIQIVNTNSVAILNSDIG